MTTNQKENQWRLNPTRFSKWYGTKPRNKLEIGISLVRLRSWVYRFIDNCRKPVEQRATGELIHHELKRTEELVISEAQHDAFTDEIKALVCGKGLPKKSSILTYTLMVTDGILRSKTRLRYSNDLTDETKYPIILPKKHPVTELIVKYHHETEGHKMGLNYTVNRLGEKYVVVHGRETVKKLNKECPECRKRFRGKPATRQMAPLPTIYHTIRSYHEAIYQLCNRFRRAVLHDSRKRQATGETLSLPICVFTDTLLSFRNGIITGNRCFCECLDTHGGPKKMVQVNA